MLSPNATRLILSATHYASLPFSALRAICEARGLDTQYLGNKARIAACLHLTDRHKAVETFLRNP